VDKPGVLKLREDQKAGIVFDRSVSLKRRQLQYDYSDGSVHLEQGTLLASELSDFESDNSSLDPAMMSVQTRYSAGHVSLTLCVTRNGPDDLGPPGQYKGIVSITDPRVSRVDLPFTIDMSYPAWPLVLDAVVLADLAGILWVWLIRQSSSGSTKVPGRNFCSWLSGAGGTAALAVGCAAGVGVWVQTYLSDSSWGTSFAAWISLVGAAFTACVAAAGAPVVIGRGQK
jgi:hypothetical protein